MLEVRRPVFVSGENPGLTLYTAGTDRVAAVASYWFCVTSPWGTGHALILHLEPGLNTTKGMSHGGIFTDNLDLAQGLVDKLTQHFQEFEGIPITQMPYVEATCAHTYDGNSYQVTCQTTASRIEIAWGSILDRKQLLWPQFPAGTVVYNLTTVICPCGDGWIKINDTLVDGEVKTAQNKEGTMVSSAFLAFSETWIGPLDRDEEENPSL